MLPFLFNSCNNDNPKPSYPYAITMTDAPAFYDAIFVDIQAVEITGSGGETVSLNVNKGVYNLLDFSNGASTLIATDTLEIAKVEQIRLVLGTNNTILVDNVSYPLSTPSADQTGLKLQVHQTLKEGVLYNVLLDFDANKSIIKLGNGNYKLKPVVRTIETATSGSIKGNITPIGSVAMVEASSGVSFSTNVNAEGNFLVMGLPAGIYTLLITPNLPFLPVTKTNVTVENGVTTNVGTIAF